jgi:hypothetical protein
VPPWQSASADPPVPTRCHAEEAEIMNHANYYAAFVYGPDGHNVEAVCHKPAAE